MRYNRIGTMRVRIKFPVLRIGGGEIGVRCAEAGACRVKPHESSIDQVIIVGR
jgi:hypothetical protein